MERCALFALFALSPLAALAQPLDECTTTTTSTTTCRGAAAPLAAPPSDPDPEALDEELPPPPPASPPYAPVPPPRPEIAAEIARPAPAAREGLYTAVESGPSLMVRGHGSGKIHLSPGGMISLRLGSQLRPQVVVAAGIDTYVYSDEASCGDCIYRATGVAAAALAAVRIHPASGPVWLELDAGVALHFVDGSRSVGPAAAAAVGWEMWRRGRTSVSLEARVAPMFFYAGSWQIEPIVAPATLSLGIVH